MPYVQKVKESNTTHRFLVVSSMTVLKSMMVRRLTWRGGLLTVRTRDVQQTRRGLHITGNTTAVPDSLSPHHLPASHSFHTNQTKNTTSIIVGVGGGINHGTLTLVYGGIHAMFALYSTTRKVEGVRGESSPLPCIYFREKPLYILSTM